MLILKCKSAAQPVLVGHCKLPVRVVCMMPSAVIASNGQAGSHLELFKGSLVQSLHRFESSLRPCLFRVSCSSKSVPCNVAYESAEHHNEHAGQMQ